MADVKISELAPAAALTNAEQVEIVQSGANVRTTIEDFVTSGFWTNYEATSPSAPTVGGTPFVRKRAGKNRLGFRGPTGAPFTFQPLLSSNKIGWWACVGNGTAVTANGFGNSVTGTLTARAIAVTNDFQMMRRNGYVAASAAVNTSFGVRHNLPQFARANSGNNLACGFEFIARWGMSVVDANLGRIAVGMFALGSALTATTDPINNVDCIFIGKDDGDANLSIFHNDGSGTCTKTTLGANFPGNTANTDMYETRFGCAPNDSALYWSIVNLRTGDLAEGSVNTDIPSATTLLSPQVWGNTGTSTTAMALDIVTMYIETDY